MKKIVFISFLILSFTISNAEASMYEKFESMEQDMAKLKQEIVRLKKEVATLKINQKPTEEINKKNKSNMNKEFTK